jgi:hypothetical protein
MKMRRMVVCAAVAGILSAAATADAGHLRCERVTNDLITVDGMLDDWRGIRGRRAGGTDRDRSFDLRCAHDDERLYVSVNVRDDVVVRTPRARADAEDHLRLRLSVGGGPAATLVVFPGTARARPVRRWGTGQAPAWLEVEDTLQEHGWSMEAAIPLSRLRGYDRRTPALDARVEYRDADPARRTKGQAVVSFDGTFALDGRADQLAAFLEATRLSRGDLTLDVTAEVDGAPGVERVVAGGGVIGVLADGFVYLRLPVDRPSDVTSVRVVDLDGDGVSSILTEYRQHGHGGSRDVVAVWRVSADGRFTRILALEVRKQVGDQVLENRWTLTRPGRFRKARRGSKGADLVVEVGEVTGWDEDTWDDVPATDVSPILLPWGERTSAVYWFEGGAALGGDPKPAR